MFSFCWFVLLLQRNTFFSEIHNKCLDNFKKIRSFATTCVRQPEPGGASAFAAERNGSPDDVGATPDDL